MPASLGRAIALGILLGCTLVHAQAPAIYTCIDSKGRRLTADRPIPECTDREQKELNPSGTIKRKMGPSLTADERALEEEKARKTAEERAREADDKRRDRALLTRYPDKPSHDKQRREALALADGAIASASKNAEDLLAQRKRMDAELEFYNKDPSKIPPKLRRQMEEADSHIDAQKRFVANQVAEKQRINARFDEELVKLKALWGPGAAPTAASPGSAARAAVVRK
ncbi:MAG: DUF4124 domain-containing protein [Ramlibacter sp.]